MDYMITRMAVVTQCSAAFPKKKEFSLADGWLSGRKITLINISESENVVLSSNIDHAETKSNNCIYERVIMLQNTPDTQKHPCDLCQFSFSMHG